MLLNSLKESEEEAGKISDETHRLFGRKREDFPPDIQERDLFAHQFALLPFLSRYDIQQAKDRLLSRLSMSPYQHPIIKRSLSLSNIAYGRRTRKFSLDRDLLITPPSEYEKAFFEQKRSGAPYIAHTLMTDVIVSMHAWMQGLDPIEIYKHGAVGNLHDAFEIYKDPQKLERLMRMSFSSKQTELTRADINQIIRCIEECTEKYPNTPTPPIKLKHPIKGAAIVASFLGKTYTHTEEAYTQYIGASLLRDGRKKIADENKFWEEVNNEFKICRDLSSQKANALFQCIKNPRTELDKAFRMREKILYALSFAPWETRVTDIMSCADKAADLTCNAKTEEEERSWFLRKSIMDDGNEPATMWIAGRRRTTQEFKERQARVELYHNVLGYVLSQRDDKLVQSILKDFYRARELRKDEKTLKREFAHMYNKSTISYGRRILESFRRPFDNLER